MAKGTNMVEEAENWALLQEQILEYQESTMRDQEHMRQEALEEPRRADGDDALKRVKHYLSAAWRESQHDKTFEWKMHRDHKFVKARYA